MGNILEHQKKLQHRPTAPSPAGVPRDLRARTCNRGHLTVSSHCPDNHPVFPPLDLLRLPIFTGAHHCTGSLGSDGMR